MKRILSLVSLATLASAAAALCLTTTTTTAITTPLGVTAYMQYSLAPHAVTQHFRDYTQQHAKQYRNEDELQYRQQVFADNLRRINAHNAEYAAGRSSFFLGPTIHADLTHGEYKRHVLSGGLRAQRSDKTKYQSFNSLYQVPSAAAARPLPKSVDWRTKGVVNPAKNQKQCGSCWSFSATGSMEGAWALATGELLDLSEQELVDCVNGGNDTCSTGGEMHDAFAYAIQSGGMEIESNYTYTAESMGMCRFEKSKVRAHFSSYMNVTDSGNELALAHAISERPTISVGIDASQFTFQMYFGGVYDEEQCQNSPEALDHGVLLVGYGVDEISEKPYWLIRNSWSPAWGVQGGYILMAKDKKNQCGVATDASFPIV